MFKRNTDTDAVQNNIVFGHAVNFDTQILRIIHKGLA